MHRSTIAWSVFSTSFAPTLRARMRAWRRIVRSARWQRPLRLVLVTGSHVGVGLVTGLASIVGIRKPQQ